MSSSRILERKRLHRKKDPDICRRSLLSSQHSTQQCMCVKKVLQGGGKNHPKGLEGPFLPAKWKNILFYEALGRIFRRSSNLLVKNPTKVCGSGQEMISLQFSFSKISLCFTNFLYGFSVFCFIDIFSDLYYFLSFACFGINLFFFF